MNKLLMLGMIAAVALALVLGLMVAGGPGFARKERMDNERISDLNRLFNYLQCRPNNRALPQTLDEADYCPDYAQVKTVFDPLTDAPYIYRRLDDSQFEVCAAFDLPAETYVSKSLSRPLKFDGQVGCMSGSAMQG